MASERLDDMVLLDFVDDKLDPTERTRVAEALARDPEARHRVELLTAGGTAAARAFAAVADLPLPRRLRDAASGPTRPPRRHRRTLLDRLRRLSHSLGWRIGGPLAAGAAGLALGLVLVPGGGDDPASPGYSLAGGDAAPAIPGAIPGPVQEALASALAGEPAPAAEGTVALLGLVETPFGADCRAFTWTSEGAEGRGLACAEAAGWRVLSLPGEAPP